MPHPLTMSTVAVLAVAGAASGVCLGRAAIAEINPVYYNEPETRFHADLVPDRPAWDSAPVHQAGQLTQAELGQALGTGCVGCRTYPEEYYPVHESSVDKYQPGYAERVEAPAPRLAVYTPEPRQDEARAADFAAVERYSSYRVAEDAPLEEPAPEVGLASGEGEAAE